MGKTHLQPPQHQDRKPGIESEMTPRPQTNNPDYKPAGKLKGKKALITGGDSGIGEAVAILFAKEGADVAISYLDEHTDASKTKQTIDDLGRDCLTLPGDISDEKFCQRLVDDFMAHYGQIDILVNNAGEQIICEKFENITSEQWEEIFHTNFFPMVYLSRMVLPHMKEGAAIVNTTSITAYAGSPYLIDYSSTKGAIVTFTRSLALSLADRKIRVNAVAPGPVWTPLIPSSFSAEHVEEFGANTALKRPGQPFEIAPCYLFLASDDSSYITGQVMHPNGGRIVNG